LSLIICHLSFSAALISCSDWNDHYDETAVTTQAIDVYSGDIVSYLRSTSDLSQMSAIFEQAGAYANTTADKQYTFVVSDNSTMSQGAAAITDKVRFANYCISDVAVTPSELTDGFGINNRAGKTIWIYGTGNLASQVKIDNFNIKKIVKTNNGYVYYIDGVLPVRQSVYEYLQSLGDDYSTFKELVAQYEERVFDREHSAAIGINQAGETIYDTIWVTRNTLMDRYTDSGIDYWNMRDENYVTTMFIPSNEQITQALTSAIDSIPVWLNREPTTADLAKFQEWIVRACFSNKRLETAQVNAGAADFMAVDGYRKVIDEVADKTVYRAADETWWRPSVQTVNTSNRVNLSNGYAYFCTNFKIPNHVVIYRVKTRFYQIWDSRNIQDDATMRKYFDWINLDGFASSISTLSSYDALYQYGWPIIDYNLLSACPTEEAVADSLVCGVEFTGLVYNVDDNIAMECSLPAGEYFLRMGFERSSIYTFDIYFNDSLVISGVKSGDMNADRIANDIPVYGLKAPGYPEGYDPEDWIEYDQNAAAYDTDGYTVGLVTQKRNGTFRIRVESKDMAYRYVRTEPGDASNKGQMLMYHWCLRPTHNNY
jgi:hypothetical protein